MPQDTSEHLVHDYLAREHMTQTELARRAGVSQPTVSRASSGVPKRHGAAETRLFTYIHERLTPPIEGTGSDLIANAFLQVWDRSDAHARAIARIIVACRGLIPREGIERDG